MVPPVTARERAPGSGNCAATRDLVGSIRLTTLPSPETSQIPRGPATIPPGQIGPVPSGIVAIASPETGSTRVTVPSSVFATQTEPKPAAMPVGISPTGISR